MVIIICPGVFMKIGKKNKFRMLAVVCVAALAVGTVRFLPQIGKVSNNVNGRELPIYSVETEKKQVALTFDAAWGNEDTKEILAILERHQIHASFFMTGTWIEAYPEDVKAIYAAGHDLGNHSEDHKNMSQLTKEQCKDEILRPHQKVKELTGIEMKLFRPPYGDYEDQVITAAKECGYESIQWSVDSLDWKDYGAESIADMVLGSKELKSGAIILMHNGAKFTKDALETVIIGLQKKGYEIVPVSRLIYEEPYHLDVTGRQIKEE